MSEVSPEHSTHVSITTYEGDSETKRRLLTNAEAIIAIGNVRDNGLTDNDWVSEFFGKRFVLTRILKSGEQSKYFLTAEDWPISEEDSSIIAFSDKGENRNVVLDMVMGPLAVKYSNVDEALESIEMTLLGYLGSNSEVKYEE